MNRERLSAQVSSWHPSTNEITQNSFLSTVAPYGLILRHTIYGGTITNITGNGTTVTYTCRNNFSAGDKISIIGVKPSQYNLTNVTVATASTTQFTITNSATGTYTLGSGAPKGSAFTYFQIPVGITWVYAFVVGGGGPGATYGGTANNGGGGGGGIGWGWTYATDRCYVGSGGSSNSSGYPSRYGIIIGGGGACGFNAVNNANTSVNGPGAGGPGDVGVTSTPSGRTNMWGTPGSSDPRFPGSGGCGGTPFRQVNGGNGISGGGGGSINTSGTTAYIGGNGGSGIVGGGGGTGGNTTGLRTPGNGGNGLNILTNTQTLGGTIPITSTNSFNAACGGGGVIGNGGNPYTIGNFLYGGDGGLGGGGGGAVTGGGVYGDNVSGGSGGNGVIYIWY